jgi:hypothetical protein
VKAFRAAGLRYTLRLIGRPAQSVADAGDEGCLIIHDAGLIMIKLKIFTQQDILRLECIESR